jgi:uncharacterized protein YjeT (DUF2065 family)
MKLIITVIGLIMVFEGIPYFAFPEKMQETLKMIAKMPPETLRKLGFAAIVAGVGLCYLARQSGVFDG